MKKNKVKMIRIKIIRSSQKIHLSQTRLFIHFDFNHFDRNHFDFIMIEMVPKKSSSKLKPIFFMILYLQRGLEETEMTRRILPRSNSANLCALRISVWKKFSIKIILPEKKNLRIYFWFQFLSKLLVYTHFVLI